MFDSDEKVISTQASLCRRRTQMAGINQPQRDAQGIKLHDRLHEVLPESALRLLFERSPDAILLIDGPELVDCNPAAVEMLGYDGREKLLSTRPSELSPPLQPDGRSSFEKADEMIATALARGSHRFEWVCTRADGTVLPVEILLTAITLEGTTDSLQRLARYQPTQGRRGRSLESRGGAAQSNRNPRIDQKQGRRISCRTKSRPRNDRNGKAACGSPHEFGAAHRGAV